MLDITGTKLYQNFFSIEIQLTIFVIVVLLSALGVLRYCKMDILRATQNRQRFYHNFEAELKSSTLKMLQAAGLARTQPRLPDTPPLSSHGSTFSHRTSASESCVSVTHDRSSQNKLIETSSIVDDFINTSPHRTCQECRKYEKTLQSARESLETAGTYIPWAETETKATLEEYEEFIERMMQDYDRLRMDKEIAHLHIKNLTTAFENLQVKYEKAKNTIAGQQKNERSYLAQLSKYETMFNLISEANQEYQERERKKLHTAKLNDLEESKKKTKPSNKRQKSSRSMKIQIDSKCE